MKLFVIISLVATIGFAFATYHPVRVCEQTSTKTSVHYYDNGGFATIDKPSVICHDSHL